MNNATPATHARSFRVFSALLLSYLMIVMPFAQMAAAAGRQSGPRGQKAESSRQTADGREQPADGSRQSAATADALFVNHPTIGSVTATKQDAYTARPGPALPGDTVTYTVDVNNSALTDATSVNFADTIDPNTTLVGGSVTASPLA